jgi:aspartate/methionine/tyrosine aminotransferase
VLNAPFVRDTLPDGWLDLGIGEARLIRRALENTLGLDFLLRSTDDELDYQPMQGNADLLSEAERLHKAPCVATCGAKQAVFAALMVAKARGCNVVGMRAPAWPPLVHTVLSLGMHVTFCDPGAYASYDCFLLVSPNNPDGYEHPMTQALTLDQQLRAAGKFLIHDAAYACVPYTDEPCPTIGDVQVVSVSKRFGLSGLRVGWAVARDESTFSALGDAVETISAGVCGTAQGAVAKLLKRLRLNPRLASLYQDECRAGLEQSRELALQFDPQVLEVDARQITCGAFAWCKKGPRYDMEKLKVRLVDGASYGSPSHVRVNLVGELHDVRELTRRTHQI